MCSEAADMTVHWCAGMYASGSTWAYNVMREIVACLHPDRPVAGRFVNTLADLAGIDDQDVHHVVKTHDLPTDVAAALSAHAGHLVVTIRDPRDAVTSLMLYQRYPFAMALDTIAKSASFVAGFAADPRALLLRYEDGFPDAPETPQRIARLFGGTLTADQAASIFAQSRRDAIEQRIQGLASLPGAQHDPCSGDIFDPQSQWHKHHAGRTGEIGRWRRTLLPNQITAIETTLADWMARFAYPRAPLLHIGYSVSLGSFTIPPPIRKPGA